MNNDQRDEMLEEISKTLVRIETASKAYFKLIDGLVITIKGNGSGRPGLLTRVYLLEWAIYTIAGSVLATILYAGCRWVFGQG